MKKETKDITKCSFCGSVKGKILGECYFCHKVVCCDCGNKQVSQEKGEIIVHSHCFNKNFFTGKISYKFFQFKMNTS